MLYSFYSGFYCYLFAELALRKARILPGCNDAAPAFPGACRLNLPCTDLQSPNLNGTPLLEDTFQRHKILLSDTHD